MDEFGLNDFESQDLLEAVEIVESNPNSPAKLTKYMPSSERTRTTHRISLDASEVARRLDFGSQRPTTRKLSKERHKQATVDNYFMTSKPGLVQAHIDSRKRLGISKDDSIGNMPLVSASFKEPCMKHRSSNNKLASELAAEMDYQTSHPTPNPRVAASRPAEVSDLTSGGGFQIPLKSHASRRSSLFRKSFGELSSGSAETSFNSVFSRSRSSNAAAPGESPMTSCANSTPGSQVEQIGDGHIGTQRALEGIDSGAKLTVTGASVPSIKQSAQNYRLRDLPTKGLFASALPPNLLSASSWVRYECLRLCQRLAMDPNKLSHLKANALEDYQVLWDTFCGLNSNKLPLPSKTSTKAWTETKARSSNVCLSAKLRFHARETANVFELQLLPLQLERSCRFFRRFGAHRFLKLSLPSIERDIPSYLQGKEGEQGQARQSIQKWIAVPHKKFMGYEWTVFSVKARRDKNKTKQETQNESWAMTSEEANETRGHDVFLFATRGHDLEAISVSHLLDWFLPFELNLSSMACKAFARIELGISKTVPTLRFLPSQIYEVGDVLADGAEEATSFNDPQYGFPQGADLPEKSVMNDGCSRMSVAAARLVWAALGGSGPLPAVFQARMGPWKGIWTVTPTARDGYAIDAIWIEVTPSQTKFVRHTEDLHDLTYEPERLTFEVVQWSRPPKESTLHIEYLPILRDRGVPRRALEDLVTTMLDRNKGSLETALSSTQTLLKWIHDHYTSEAEENFSNDASRLPEEKIKLLLGCGFEYQVYSPLQLMVKNLAKSWFKRVSADLRVPLSRSTYVYGIADPLGILLPGEIHLAFSTSFGESADTYLHDVDAVVARHPACRRSDMQKVKTVFKLELGHIKDVVVFPSRGCIPLASRLQGGDYDGDEFWICWEPLIVERFANAPSPVLAPEPESVGITLERRTVGDLICMAAPNPLENFLEMVLGFALESSQLGLLTSLHTTVCYHQNKISSAVIDKMADLHDLLVDTAKNGYRFTSAQLAKFQQSLNLKPFETKQPKYKSYTKTSLFGKDSFPYGLGLQYAQIVDHLMLTTARSHSLAILNSIDALKTSASSFDDAVGRIREQAWISDKKVVRDTVRLLAKDFEQFYKDYCEKRKSIFENPNKSLEKRNSSLDDLDEKFSKQYTHIQPVEQHYIELEAKAWFRKTYESELSYWDQVKASTFFSVMASKTGINGGNLLLSCDLIGICHLKSYSKPGGRPILTIPSVYRDLRMRAVKINPEVERNIQLGRFSKPNTGVIDDVDNDTELDESDTDPEEEFHGTVELLSDTALSSMSKKTISYPKLPH